MGTVRGKRGCCVKMAFLLHVLGFVALVGGCLTPYWSLVKNDKTGDVVSHEGLVIHYNPGDDWQFRDFNDLKKAGSDEKTRYLAMSVGFGLGSIVLEFFLVEAFAFALYNASCGAQYNPDILMICSLLTGGAAVASLVLYEQYTGRALEDSTDVKMDYSRGFVIIFVALSFLSAFFIVCDRKEGK